jgi:hypothetical protein
MNEDRPIRVRRCSVKNAGVAVPVVLLAALALAGCSGHGAKSPDTAASTSPPAQMARGANTPGAGSSNQRLIVHGSIMAPQKAPLSAGAQYQPH